MKQLRIILLLFISIPALAQVSSTETFLQGLPLEQMTLKKIAEGNTTPTLWKVKNADGKTVAALKCTGGNTNFLGATVTYELGKVLDFNIFPTAVVRDIDFSKLKFIGEDGKQVIATLPKQKCALKEWMNDFSSYYWKNQITKNSDGSLDESNTFLNAKDKNKTVLVKAINCKEKFDPSQEFIFYQAQKKEKTYGHSTLGVVAVDFSNLMLMDALIGNMDRFPGGNLHFISSAHETKVSEENENIKELVAARLFSLDNEASLKRRGSNGMIDLKKYVTRFDKQMVQRLEKLDVVLSEILSTDVYPEGFEFLNFNTQNNKMSLAKLLHLNIVEILSYIKSISINCGEQIYF